MENQNLLMKARANRISALNGIRSRRMKSLTGKLAAMKPVVQFLAAEALPSVDAAELQLSRRLDMHFASRRSVSMAG